MNPIIIDFGAAPYPFLVGDRCHLKTTPFMRQTMGTVVSTDGKKKAPGAGIQWDDGGFSYVSVIAIEPITFRPTVMLKETWEQATYKDSVSCEGIEKVYKNVLQNDNGVTTLIPVVVIDQQLPFQIGCDFYYGLECLTVDASNYVLLNYCPNVSIEGDWQVIQVKLIDVGIIDASQRKFFRSWEEAHKNFITYQSLFSRERSQFIEKMKALLSQRDLKVRLGISCYELDHGYGMISTFQFGEEESLEGFVAKIAPRNIRRPDVS